MSEAGTKVISVPGGEKLLSNTEETGRLLMSDYKLAREVELLSKHDLLQILEGHSRIGDAMVRAAARTRKAMEARS